MKKLNVLNLFFNLVVALMIGALFSVPAYVSVSLSLIAGTLMSFAPNKGILMSGLQKEIWTDILLEKFYPNGSFLSTVRDMSALVENNKINLAEAGANPDVLVDNTSYPIATSTRTDTALELPLKTLDTTSTIVRNLEAMEVSYDKVASVLSGHKAELLKVATRLAAWNYAPSANATNTPVLAATGAVSNGNRKLTISDVLKMMVAFNNLDVPSDGRILVLNPQHEADLLEEDLLLYKTAMMSGKLFGFQLFSTSATPRFNAETGAKVAYAAVSGATDTISSVAFHKDEVMKAMGTIEMFSTLKDPANKGDIFNFQMRFCALPLRSKYIGAIYSPHS